MFLDRFLVLSIRRVFLALARNHSFHTAGDDHIVRAQSFALVKAHDTHVRHFIGNVRSVTISRTDSASLLASQVGCSAATESAIALSSTQGTPAGSQAFTKSRPVSDLIP